MNRIVLTLAAGLTLAAPAASQQPEPGRLVVQNGNVFVQRPITSDGKDGDAVLSPDGRTAYFIRKATDTEPADKYDGAATEIMTVDATDAAPRVLLPFKGASEPEGNLRGFQMLRLSPNGRTLYFLADAWATSAALHALDVTTGKERFVSSSIGYFVAGKPPNAGNLVVQKHKYVTGGGSFDHWWLMTPDGREIRDVGPDLRTARRLLE